MVPASDVEALKPEAAKLARAPITDTDLSTAYRFGDGVLSPLTCPMDSATYNGVLDHAYIGHGGKRYAWTIPLSFPVTSELADKLATGQRVALTNKSGDIVATLDITDVFPWD